MNLCESRQESSCKKEHFSGIGIQNVRERLELIYGKKDRKNTFVHIDSMVGKGTVVTICIPVARQEE